jgi:hypothetical protein
MKENKSLTFTGNALTHGLPVEQTIIQERKAQRERERERERQRQRQKKINKCWTKKKNKKVCSMKCIA